MLNKNPLIATCAALLFAVTLCVTPAFAADAGRMDYAAGTSALLDGQQGEEDTADGVEMHRLYNPNSGEHFYTADTEERSHLVEAGWVYEGVGWIAPEASSVPVYRLYNEYAGEHHYTMDAAERDALAAAGWTSEGVGWHSADDSALRVALYRDYDPYEFACNHNYTVDAKEHANLVSAGWLYEGPAWYGLPTEESLTKGWVLDGSVWRYYEKGSPVAGKWVVEDCHPAMGDVAWGTQRYWVDAEGALATARLIDKASDRDKAAGYYAYAHEGGYVVRGKYDDQAGHVFVADDDGRLPDDAGWLVTGRYDDGLQRYFIDAETHAARAGLFEEGGELYYGIGGEGYVARGKHDDGAGHVYLADNDGRLATEVGWLVTDRYDGELQRYYIDSAEHAARTGLFEVDGSVYFGIPGEGYVVRGRHVDWTGRVYLADNDGRLPAGGWLGTDSFGDGWQRYYIDPVTHDARTGLFTADGAQYFGYEGLGYVARNMWRSLGDAWYWVGDDGAFNYDAVVTDLVRMAQGYSSPSQYLIMVDVDDPRTVVLEGSQGNWSVKFIWDCCTGAPESPTVVGVFSVGIKGYSFGEGHGYSCYYYTQFYGDYLFHTRKYYAYSDVLLDGRMGERVSEGCVRLYDEDAIWIQDNVPWGTTVVTTY